MYGVEDLPRHVEVFHFLSLCLRREKSADGILLVQNSTLQTGPSILLSVRCSERNLTFFRCGARHGGRRRLRQREPQRLEGFFAFLLKSLLQTPRVRARVRQLFGVARALPLEFLSLVPYFLQKSQDDKKKEDFPSSSARRIRALIQRHCGQIFIASAACRKRRREPPWPPYNDT